MTDQSTDDAPPRPPSKWSERLWLFGALILCLAAAVLFGLQRLGDWIRTAGITHEIDAELVQVDYIEATPGALAGYNVVFITTDTTRADHIGCYGNRGVETPVIDELAHQGILFSQAVTPSPSTLPAHGSLLTGLYPFHHGARANGTFKLEEKVTTLAERLQAKGYRTGAVISAFVLDSRYGLDQGFDLYHDDLTKGMQYSQHMFRERAAELTNEPATAWLRENADQPFFLWVHYFDPHAVYLPPEPFRSRYANDLYDGEIAYADSQIGALLDQLEESGVRDRTLVVYTSDHGEGLGEHGEQTHSLLVHDATLHVPMIMNCPGALPEGKLISEQSSLVDVVPTVLALLGEDVPDELDGRNWCQPTVEQSRPVLIESISTMTLHGWAPLVGVRRTDYKYVLAPTPELYDLANDPRELTNLHDTEPETVAELSSKLVEWLGQDPFLAARRAVDLSNVQVDQEAMRHLAALGYVSTTSGEQDETAELPDPKEMVQSWEIVQKAIHLGAEGDPQGAVTLLEPHLAIVPNDVYARTILAGVYRQLGDTERALTHFMRIAEDEPNDPMVHLSLANMYIAAGEYDVAEKSLQRAVELAPESGHAQITLGQLALSRGQPNEAMDHFEKAIELDPGSTGADAYNKIGFIYLYSGRLEDAREAYQNSIKIDSLNGEAHDGLANILMLEERMDEAMAQLEVALRFDPNQSRALTSLASLLSLGGDQDRALDLCNRALNIRPTSPTAHNNLGLIYRRRGELESAEEHYLKAIEHSEQFDAPHVNLAQLYLRQGKTDEALEQFKLAVADNPIFPNPIALANLGAHAYNHGNVPEALALYGRALQVDPDYAMVHRYVATIFARPEIDRPDLTAFHVRRTLELDPDQSDVADLMELLRKAEEEVARRTQGAAAQADDRPGADKTVPGAPPPDAGSAQDDNPPLPSAANSADPTRE